MDAQPKYILCDMDGTLIDTEGIKYEAWRLAVADAMGEEPGPDEFRKLYIEQVGAPGLDIAEAFRDHYGLAESGEQLHEMREEHRRAAYADRTALAARVFDPLVEIIKRLRDGFGVLGAGRIVLVTTASEEQVGQVMEATGLRPLFDDVVCGLEKSAENPACYRAALDRLGATPEECLVIEDTVRGYAAARALGIPCMLIPNEYTREQRM